jgi:hypothetical protein
MHAIFAGRTTEGAGSPFGLAPFKGRQFHAGQAIERRGAIKRRRIAQAAD